MHKDWLKDYFSFSKKERTAVIILILLIFLVAVIPYLLPDKKDPVDKEALEQFQQEIARLKPVSKDSFGFHESGYNRKAAGYEHDTPEKIHTITKLFYFDPNTLPEEGWIKLGLPEKTARTIRHYIEKGGKFRKPEDITKIYSLQKDEAEKLLPYVRLPEAVKDVVNTIQKENIARQPYTRSFKPHYTDLIIDINHTDTTTLQLLPGIGSKLATRIMNFKERLGGFYSVDQIAETYGLPDSTFQKIKPYLKITEPQVTSININTTDANQLKQHPYFKWNIANAIIQYRIQHGNFKQKEELLQIAAISPELYKKLTPYISIE